MNAEWNIRACADQCAACRKKFADRETLMSRVRFTADGYVRDDYCAGCWPGREPGADAETSAWSAVWHAPAPKAPEALKKETAESLLRELMETEDPSKRNVIFILAVMLERRRLLVEKEVQLQPDGIKIRVYEHKQTGESFVVPDPQLKLAEIESVQREVMELLGIPAPGAKATPPDSQAAENGNSRKKPAEKREKPAQNAEKPIKTSEKAEKPAETAENSSKMTENSQHPAQSAENSENPDQNEPGADA
ncbi:MAG TPA: hypothetical protein PLJ99_04210 [Kiritimatiellia bacterium]|nr:hypothetical protein [Kiritimatiellia bacterium]